MATPLPRSQFPVTEHHLYLNIGDDSLEGTVVRHSLV